METNNENKIQSNWISDDELENLITSSFERQEVLDEINRAVMSEVKQSSRKETLRHWARLVAFSFGVPFVLFCFCFGIYYICTHVEMQPYMWVIVALPTIAILYFLGKKVKDFSISEV